MPVLLNIMNSLTFAGAVLFFIVPQTILGYDHVNESTINPVATDDQPRESNIEPLTTQSFISPGCPERCSCQMNDTHHIIIVDCSNEELALIPDFPESTVKLLLRNNTFSFPPSTCDAFKHLRSLEYLDLTYNMIVDLPKCVFWSQKGSLLNLYIPFNGIRQLNQTLFQNLSQLETLDLAGNLITELSSGIFSDLVQLKHLNLSLNHIYNIDPHAFKGLHSLKSLNLHNNWLDSSLPKDVFQDLGALEELYMRANQGSLDDAVSPLKNLSYLEMDVNVTSGYTKLGTGFRQLINLRSLDFSIVVYEWDVYGRYKPQSTCYLTYLPSDFFENIQTEKDFTLIMIGCYIEKIGNSAFRYLPTLVTLDLRANPDLNFDVNCGDWIDSLTNTTISHLDISETKDCGHDLDGGCLDRLAKTNITTLNLQYNNIYTINGLRYFIPAVEKLSVSGNGFGLYMLYFWYARFGYQDLKLRELDASDQVFDKNYQVNYGESELTPAWESCPLDLKGQDPYIDIICLPPDLEAIYASSALGPDRKTLGTIQVLNNTVLRHVDLSDNLLTNLLGPIENVPSLKFLDLSRNQCENLDTAFFMYMVNLETLILKENFLALTFKSDINGLIFSNLTNLRMLDLSQNFLTDLSSQVFIYNSNLEILDLSNNRLSGFQPSISTINNLSFLNLSLNLLPGLSEQTCEELKLLKSKNENFSASLLGNPLLYTCDYLPFLDLVNSNPHIFFGLEHMVFKCVNGSEVFYKDLAHHFPSLARECLIQRLFDVVLVAFFVVVGTVSICAVIYHKRWKLRYLYYIGQRRMHIGEHMVEYAPDADVFITYDQDDLRWRRFMQQTFLPGLNQRNITYILGETDFPGGDIMAHVAGAVVGTRKTVILLSEEIFDDHHREFEMNLAIMREMDTRSLKIVPVFVEEFNLALYPAEIEIFLRNQWYRCLHYDDGDFWDGFVAAVKEDN